MQGKFDKTLQMMMEQTVSSPFAPLCIRTSTKAPSFLLAVSGGVDSMVMADLFLHSRLCPDFALAHCNFSLRGEESDGDEALVTAWAEAHQIRLFKVRFDTVAYAREHALSIEMAARDLRYGWFRSLSRANAFDYVAVAHNANDNAETLFLNLLRGTGVRGLAGMSLLGELPLPQEGTDGSVSLARPLLAFTRKQIEGYARAHGISWREDRTNAEVEYKRNRIRNQVFPLFEQINPSFLRTLQQEMGRFAEAEEILTDYWEARRGEIMDLEGRISVARLKAQAHWPYLLYRCLEEYGFHSAVIHDIEDLLRSERTFSGKTFCSPDYCLVTTSDALIISKLSDSADDAEPVEVAGAGTYVFGGRSYEIRIVDRTPDLQLRQPEGILLADADCLSFPFWLRAWEEGDWFHPFGMKGRKKVSDFFTDHKFTLQEKKTTALLVDGPDKAAGHILAILGHRIDNALAITPSTTRVVVIAAL